MDTTEPQTMKRRKFTDWINDPDDERIIVVPSRVPGLPAHRYKMDKDEHGNLTMHELFPPIFTLPDDMFAP